MMKKTLSYVAILICTLIYFPLYAASVKSFSTFLYQRPQFQSEKKLKLSRGEPVQKLEKSGNWVKIKAQDKTGWVHQMSLSDQAYKTKISISKFPARRPVKRSRNPRLRTARAAVGVKGLRESQANQIKESSTDFESVKKMESFAISEEEAFQFLAEYQE